MPRALALLLTGAFLACGCHVLVERTTGARIRRPPRLVRGECGIVRAHGREIAEMALQLLSDLGPRVEQSIGCGAAKPEIWILGGDLARDSRAQYLSGEGRSYIVLAPTEPDDLEYVLAHELAHWYSDACGVDLPAIVEEGLADLVTIELVPEWAESIRWTRRGRFENPMWTREQALHISFDDWMQMSAWEELEPRGIGFAIVEELGRTGVAGLRAQARARGLERVPAEWFLGDGSDGSEVR